MDVEERKCDFYLVEIGEGNKTATRTFDNNTRMRGYCINGSCPNGGDMPEDERRYVVNNKTTIPFRCWLGMLRGD